MTEVLNMAELEKLMEVKRILAESKPLSGYSMCVDGEWFRVDENGNCTPLEPEQ